MTRLEPRSLAALAAIMAVAACNQDGPTQQRTPAASPALTGASPRKHTTVYEPDIQIISRIPVKVSRDGQGTCKWGEIASALNGYIDIHPEKVRGRSASLSDYDEDTCEGTISVKIDRPSRQQPMRAETTTVRYPNELGLSAMSPSRLIAGDSRPLALDGGEPWPPEDTCHYYFSLGSNSFNFNTKQDLRVERTQSVKIATQLTAWGRYYSVTNPSSMACVKVDSSKVIRSWSAYYDPEIASNGGITQLWAPAPTNYGDGWAWCSQPNTNGCVVEAYASVFTRFIRGCSYLPQSPQYFYFGSPNNALWYIGYYGRMRTDGIAQISNWASPYGFGGPDVIACANFFGEDTLKYNAQF